MQLWYKAITLPCFFFPITWKWACRKICKKISKCSLSCSFRFRRVLVWSIKSWGSAGILRVLTLCYAQRLAFLSLFLSILISRRETNYPVSWYPYKGLLDICYFCCKHSWPLLAWRHTKLWLETCLNLKWFLWWFISFPRTTERSRLTWDDLVVKPLLKCTLEFRWTCDFLKCAPEFGSCMITCGCSEFVFSGNGNYC